MSINEGWIKKMWCIYKYIYNGTSLSDKKKKNEIMLFTATQMDLEIITLSEVNQIKTNIIWYHLYVESKKKTIQVNLYAEQKQIHFENKLTVTRGERRGWGEQWIRGLGLAYAQWGIWNDWPMGDLLSSTANSIQYFVIIYVGKESEKEWMCVHV